MTTKDREQIQRLYVRYCADSLFRMDAIKAAQFTARVLGIHPLEFWLAMPSWEVMEEIAAGRHPASLRLR